MNQKNTIEIITGFIVIIIFAATLWYAGQKQQKVDVKHTYTLNASFSNASGIAVGSEVRISGVKIGSVTGFELDSINYNAILKLAIQNNIKLPIDSSAKILSNSLIGDKFISLTPDIDDTYLGNNDLISFTQSSLSFEELLSKLLFGMAEKK